MSALFSNPNARGGGSSSSSSGRVLVEFRAGKMSFDEKSKRVTPDKRKGLIQVEQGEDQLMHFRWRERASSGATPSVNAEDELIIFPDDVEYKRVKECTTGRVFVLKFKASDKLRFFWMQEPKEDKDEELCKKVNESLNNPPAANSGMGGSGRSGGSGNSASTAASLAGLADAAGLDLSSVAGSEGGLEALLNNMSQPQLMQLFGAGADGGGSALLSALGSGGRQRSSGGRSSATKTASSSSGGGGSSRGNAGKAIKVSDLQSVLSGIQGAQSDGQSGGASAGNVANLGQSLNSESVLRPLLSNEAFVARMKQHVPQGEQLNNAEIATEIRDTVSSSHFQGLMSEFSAAFASGELGAMMREFELPEPCVAAAEQADMEAFVKALQEAEASKKDKPEDMALD